MTKCVGLLVVLMALNISCTTVLSGDGSSVDNKLTSNPKIPKTQGRIKVTSTNFNSSRIELTVKNLMRPEKINPKAKAYIVWEVPPGNGLRPQSLGPLKIDKDFNAQMLTATPFRSFDLFITVEPKANQLEPTGEKLLWTTVDR